MPHYLTLDDVEVDGLTVLVRSDLNVPIEDGVITDDFRIRAALPTLERLVDSGARVSVCSHLGRPEGSDPAFSLRPVAEAMAALSSKEVGAPGGGQITILENTRFDPRETDNDPALAARLADGSDLFVQDAFGSVHRAHASTVGIADLVKSRPLLDAELTALSRFLGDPPIPYVVVLGGAKVTDKLGVIENLLPRVDAMLIGGGMLHAAQSKRWRSALDGRGRNGGQGARARRGDPFGEDHRSLRRRRSRRIRRALSTKRST